MKNEIEGTFRPCAACHCINKVTIKPSSITSEKTFYLLCQQGHIMCSKCLKNHENSPSIKLTCPVDQSHQKFSPPIECLKPQRDNDINRTLRNYTHSLENNLKDNRTNLAKLQLQYYKLESKVKPFAAHNNIHETTTQNIIDEFTENEALIKDRIRQCKQKIQVQRKRYWTFVLIFDTIFAAIILVGFILQTVAVINMTLFNNNSASWIIFDVYFAIFGVLVYSFLKVTLLQAWIFFKQSQIDGFLKTIIIILSIALLPLLIPFTMSMNSIEIIKRKQFKSIFFIPKAFPFDKSFNYVILVIKTAFYYIFIATIYYDSFQTATFIWSFLQILGFLYFNARENENKIQKKKQLYSEEIQMKNQTNLKAN